MTKVLAISGSLRKGSLNTGLIEAAAEHAPDGVEVEIYDGVEALPRYNADRDGDEAPLAARELRHKIEQADALFISTPEYNGTIPAGLKDVIDWGSRPFGTGSSLYSKPVAVAGVSPSGYGAVWAQDHLRRALGIAGARVSEIELTVGGANDKFDEDGKLTDAETIGRLEEVLDTLVTHHLAKAA